ncbi:MAG: FHA domain-containing protein [Gallionella sp.]|jgi:pSer/pThr/pTyr-binding forkhead associated (FHA) protein
MTAKLILSLDGALIQEYPLNKERVTVGRKTDNDIVINNLAVSSHHAAIITILHDSFMEDLDSTNGLTVNGVPVKKHFLQSNDVIEIGKYKLKYLNDHVSQTSAADFEKTMIMRAPAAPFKAYTEKSGDTGLFQNLNPAEPAKRADAPPVAAVAVPPAVPAPVTPAAVAALAAIQILNGPNAGKELDLVKGLTTLGKPGVQVAVLTRRPHGFFITHVEGASFPLVNGQALDSKPFQLKDHDLIELAGVKMEFYFKN